MSSTRSRSPRATPARRSTPPSCRPEAALPPPDLVRPVARIRQLTYYPQLVDRLRVLAGQGLTAHAIANQLAAENIRAPHQRERFNDGEILQLLHRHGLRPAPAAGRPRAAWHPGPGRWWLADLARELDMPAATLFGWLKRGWVTGRQEASPPHRWIIAADLAEVERWSAVIVTSSSRALRNPIQVRDRCHVANVECGYPAGGMF